MPTRNFRELLGAMPVGRHKVEERFQKSLAATPLDQLQKAHQRLQIRVLPGASNSPLWIISPASG